jgi:Mn-dependent DtxR family transcriptional regulator
MHLTDAGQTEARRLIRSHRLWEQYLQDQTDLPPDHLHATAERLEHVTDAAMRERLAKQASSARQDPHGREIPEED